MGESNRLSIIKRLMQWECELSEIRFPAFGSLHYKGSLGGFLGGHELISLDQSVDLEGLCCVDPSCGTAWSIKHSPSADYSRGPCKYRSSWIYHS